MTTLPPPGSYDWRQPGFTGKLHLPGDGKIFKRRADSQTCGEGAPAEPLSSEQLPERGRFRLRQDRQAQPEQQAGSEKSGARPPAKSPDKSPDTSNKRSAHKSAQKSVQAPGRQPSSAQAAPAGQTPGAAAVESALRQAGAGEAFWKAGKDLSTHHEATLTTGTLHSVDGVLGLIATGALGDNLAGKVPVLPQLPFLEDLNHWGAALDKTQQLQQDVLGADGSMHQQSAADYLQLRDGKLSGKLNDQQAGQIQASGNLDFAQQSLDATVTGRDGESVTTALDVDDQKFSTSYKGGQGKMQASTGVDLKHQQLDASMTSVDGQKISAHGDVNDKIVGMGYDGGKDRISTSGEVNLGSRSTSAQLTSADDHITGSSSLGLADGLQSDSFVAYDQTRANGQSVDDRTKLRLGRRVGLGFDHTVSAVPGQTAPETGWNVGAYHDRRTGRNELSGGLKNSVQAGVASGGEEGTAVNLSLGQHVVGKELGSAGASVSLKPDEIQTDLGIGQHKSHFKLNATGVEADLSVPLGAGPKAPAIGGGFKRSRVNDSLSESLQMAKDGSDRQLRTLTVSDDDLWGAHVKYVDATSGIAGKFSIEKNTKQDLSFTGDAGKLAALPDTSALDSQIDALAAESKTLKHAVSDARQKLSDLQAERKKVVEKQEQPRLTRTGRVQKLQLLDGQIAAQQKQLAEVQSPAAEKARNTRQTAIGLEIARLKADLAPLEAARKQVVSQLDHKAAQLLDDEQPEASLAAASALAPGEKLGLRRERDIGWTIEAGLRTDATASYGHTGKAKLDLSVEGLGESKVRVTVSRSFELDQAIKAQAAGIATLDRLGERDNTRSYTLELDLATPAGKAAYTSLLEPVNRLGRPLPEFSAADGVCLDAEIHKQRQASTGKRGLDIGGQVRFSANRRQDFTQSFDELAQSSAYIGQASHLSEQDSKPLPVIGKLFGHEEKLTGGNYELRSNGDQSLTLSLKLTDETVRHTEASAYGQLYQQSMGAASVPAAARSVVRTYNDRSSLDLKLELKLDPGNVETIVTAPRARLIAVASQCNGISGIEARFFAHRLAKAETAAAAEAEQLGLQGDQRSAHLQAARLRSVLEFVEKHGQAAVPFLQQLTEGCIQVSDASLDRGGYAPQNHLTPERLAELGKARASASGEGATTRKQVKTAESWQQELDKARDSIRLSLDALGHDPLIGARQKLQIQANLIAHLQAIETERGKLSDSGLLSEHASYRADDLVSPAQAQSWSAQLTACPPASRAARQLCSAVGHACQRLDNTIGELQANRMLPPERRVALIQALLDRRLQLETMIAPLQAG